MKKIDSEIIDISWKKTILSIKLHVPGGEDYPDLAFLLVNRGHIAVTEFQVGSADQGTYELSLNVTNSGINRCIDNGVYRILATDDKEVYSLAEYHGRADDLLDKSCCLRTNSQKHAYTTTFFINESEDDPVFSIQFQYMKNTGMSYLPPLVPPEKGGGGLRKSFEKFISKRKSEIKERGRKLSKWYYSTRHRSAFKEDGKKIVFLSDASNTLSENLQCLYDRMCERGLDKEYDISFSLINRSLPVGSKLDKLKRNIRKLSLVSEANIIIIDDTIALFNWLILDERQTVIQVWHSGAGFKCIGYARWGALNAPGAFIGHRQWTYFVSDSEKIAFEWALLAGIRDEQVIPTGMPRIDKFLDPEHKEETVRELYASYPALKDRKIILFAPTYRGADQSKAYYPFEKIDFDALYRCCKEKGYAVVFKMHPFVLEPVPIREDQKDLFLDLTGYGSINDLFYITDVLITDYSSNMYEYSLMNKPMLAFAFDELQYSSSHGFPRLYDENIPGKTCHSFDEIVESLMNDDFQYEKHEQYVKKYFDHIDTNNCDRVIDWLILGGLPEEYSARLQKKIDRISRIRGKSYEWLLANDEE